MDDFQTLGFSSFPKSQGNSQWKVILGSIVAIAIIYLIVHLIVKSINRGREERNSQFQAIYKPIEVNTGWYAVRGFSGYYTKERLQELGLWIEK